MNITSRSYLTAGIAALGVGAIAVTPIQPLPSQAALAPQRAVSSLAVDLASSINPIEPWVQTFQTTFANIQALFEFYLQQPFPLIQTISANVVTYFEELTSGQGGAIPEQIWNNIVTFFEAPWDPGQCATDPCDDPAFYEGDYISNVPITNTTLLGKLSQREVYQSLPLALSGDPDLLTTLAPLLGFAATHYSGQLAGLIGPLVAPLIVLTRSFTAIGEFFQAGDVIGAINELINIPANVTNGVLNGAGYLDLTGVVNAIQPLPDTIKSIGLNLGGLFSPPVPFEGTLTEPTALNGGTLFDNIAADAEVSILKVKTPGIPVSWFGSVIGLGQFLGDEMVVTPPAPPTAAAEPVAAKLAAPVDLPAPALTEETPPLDPAPVEDSVTESAPAIEKATVESAPAVVDLPEQEAPADFAADPAPEPAVAAVADVGADDAGASEAGGAAGDTGDSGSRAGDSRRGARDAD